jgi:pimeloyl-ACP methyl ester carboxylesterase
MTTRIAYENANVPEGIRSRFVDNHNGLSMHVLEAGYETPNRPCVLLLHGFPELAFSWRKIMLPLADAGFYVIAPDQRGYGRTTGWDGNYDGDVDSYRVTNLLRDIVGLLAALGLKSVSAVFGHDAGSFVSAWCALVRPDIFRSVALMSAPFGGPRPLPFNTANGAAAAPASDIHAELAALPRPRKHYQWYYSTRPANDDMVKCKQGIHDFMRAYYHHKSADWKTNKPHVLGGWKAEELAKMPTYYIMDLNENMAETVAHEMPTAAEISVNRWLPDTDLAVYTAEYTRNRYQGGLQWYRTMTGEKYLRELQIFSGRTIDVPAMFISGKSDWGTYQNPGSVERMRDVIMTKNRGFHLLDGAGHWVQQEQPEQVSEILLEFLREQRLPN